MTVDDPRRPPPDCVQWLPSAVAVVLVGGSARFSPSASAVAVVLVGGGASPAGGARPAL